jgi:predicted signal transduction protein with EAL and GGDEF domain
LFKFHLNKKIFWIVALLIILSNSILTIYIYQQKQKDIQERALSMSETLKSYFIAMRYVYHKQFLSSGLDFNDSTIGFLPAHASTLISDKFSEISKDNITIRNVTDRPRNLKNMADSFELEAIDFFKNNPHENIRIKKIKQDSKSVIHYTAPLFIEKYCLACHGKREEVLPSIRERYDTAYDYKVGDLRGITSIKIPIDQLELTSTRNFYEIAIFLWLTIFFLLFIVYFAIKKLTLKDVEQKTVLQKEVKIKTADLQEQKNELQLANEKQKHLFSILRTVTDCNQILITATSIDELIEKTAASMHSNTTFFSVKILLFQNAKLTLKASVGLNEDFNVLPLEIDVFQNNKSVLIKHFDESLPLQYKEKMKKYNISEIYLTPLRKNYHAKKALGVISICTTKEKGLSKEERNMINELAGDIGFAINSFYQKEAINQLSFYDSLTFLPNLKLFEQHLSQALIDSDKNLKYGAILFLDLDNFKDINDLMGNDIGNIVLQQSAQRLVSITQTNSITARYSGDKFSILLENLSLKEEEAAVIAENFAKEIQKILKEAFVIEEKSFYLTCSIGIVLFLKREVNLNILFNQAEYAMRSAKNDGKNAIRFYDESLQHVTKYRLQMLLELKKALEQKELVLYYQKQFDIDEKVVGAEALIRWMHPERGMIPPMEFIPLAEEYGIIKEIGRFVLESATDQLVLFRDNPIKKTWRISVNVSPIQFKEKGFVENLKSLIDSKNIDPTNIRIEITEGVFIDDQEKITRKIEALKSFGISISIDDFGTGYSNLNYLKNLQIDELKIDKSFVSSLNKSDSDKTIVKTIIMMGKEFNFDVIAEGVETKEQFELLKELGCDFFQGYLFAKPCSIEDIESKSCK